MPQGQRGPLVPLTRMNDTNDKTMKKKPEPSILRTRKIPAVLCTMFLSLVLAACGGGGGGGGSGSGGGGSGGGSGGGAESGTTPSGGSTATLRASNLAAAAARMADAVPRAGSVTQSSNRTGGVTSDRVTVTVGYGATGNTYSIRNGSAWSIGTDNGNPASIPGVTPPFRGTELHRRVNGGTLYVDVYSDIEAPATRQVGGGDDGTRTVPLGTLVAPRNLNSSIGGRYSNDNANIGGESGHLRCSGGCTITNGVATAGTWTFTPDRPPGAVE